jgi:hypothetical protein
MTSHVARLYALVAGVLAFFLAWAGVTAHPWAAKSTVPQDPRLVSLTARQQRIQVESVRAQKLVAQRWALYHRALANHNAAAAAAQSVAVPAPAARVVTVPPLVVTRVSLW